VKIESPGSIVEVKETPVNFIVEELQILPEGEKNLLHHLPLFQKKGVGKGGRPLETAPS